MSDPHDDRIDPVKIASMMPGVNPAFVAFAVDALKSFTVAVVLTPAEWASVMALCNMVEQNSGVEADAAHAKFLREKISEQVQRRTHEEGIRMLMRGVFDQVDEQDLRDAEAHFRNNSD